MVSVGYATWCTVAPHYPAWAPALKPEGSGKERVFLTRPSDESGLLELWLSLRTAVRALGCARTASGSGYPSHHGSGWRGRAVPVALASTPSWTVSAMFITIQFTWAEQSHLFFKCPTVS